MKTYILPFLVGAALSVSGQNLNTSVYDYPATGFQQLTKENPYMLQQENIAGQWVNLERYTHQNAPNINRVGVDKISEWVDSNNTWHDFEATLDSFVLDNQNRVQTVFEQQSYDFPGFSSASKSKYLYTYDANNRIIKINVWYANPTNSNNYVSYWNMSLKYDQDGHRISDSTYYYGQTAERYLSYYVYDQNGHLSDEYTLSEGDTVHKRTFTFTGNNIHTIISSSFDVSSDTWSIQSLDTFEYDANNRVSSHLYWGTSIINGGDPQFGPINNEFYHYTATGKLGEIISKNWVNESWQNQSKTSVLYSPQDKAVLGNYYHASGAGWENAPTYQYLFDVPTGIQKVSGHLMNASVYPNPVRDLLTIELDKNTPAAGLKLFDINGKYVLSDHTTGNGKMDLSGLDNGIYYVTIETDKGSATKKIVVQH